MKNNINKLLAILVVVIFSQLSLANTTIQYHKSKLVSSSTNTKNKDSSIQLTDEEISLAKQFQLNQNDWKKYKEIMAGPRGIWSPGLDPITALGVSATTESERKRYAEIWMKVETQKIVKELAFEVAVMQAGKKFHPDQTLINNKNWIDEWKKKNKSKKYKISVFMDVTCKKACHEKVTAIINSMGDKSVLDFYFVKGATDEAIGQWAHFMGISPETVKQRKITLNHNDNTSAIMGVEINKLPIVQVLNIRTGEVSSRFERNEQ